MALVGSSVLDDEGEKVEIKKAPVGGVVSEGMLCDSRMLGWSGGAEGIAVQIPESIGIGEMPPSSKPRPQHTQDELPPADPGSGLFERKLTKEEKKKLSEEKRKARKAAKEAKQATQEE